MVSYDEEDWERDLPVLCPYCHGAGCSYCNGDGEVSQAEYGYAETQERQGEEREN